jgi:ribosomal protein S18 acetylase RimI-like enzyme
VAGQRAPVVKTFLEIADPGELREPRQPPRRPFELERVRDPALNRWFYETVGADWLWTDRLGWSDDQWRRWEARVETWSINVDGQRAGYYELEPHPNRGFVQIAYFGLLPEYFGLGIGGHALAAAIRRGFELAPKVTVSTATTDGPHALANYEARGMRAVERRRALR